MYRRGEDLEVTYRRDDRGGDADAAFRLGLLLEQRDDVAGAEAAYGRADQRGHAAGATEVGRLLEERGDSDGAAAAYRRGGRRGDPVAAVGLRRLQPDDKELVAIERHLAAMAREQTEERARRQARALARRQARALARRGVATYSEPTQPAELELCSETGKVRYLDGRSALEAVRHNQEQFVRGLVSYRLERTYQCEFCSGWHATSQLKRR